VSKSVERVISLSAISDTASVVEKRVSLGRCCSRLKYLQVRHWQCNAAGSLKNATRAENEHGQPGRFALTQHCLEPTTQSGVEKRTSFAER